MIYCILGPSGVGKTTVALRLGLPQIISTTTREVREGEIPGKTYHYVDQDTFFELDLLERIEYDKDWYGLQTEHVQDALDTGKDHYVILNALGCSIMKRMFMDVRVIYLKAPPRDLVGFMKKRGDSDKKIIGRLCTMIEQKEFSNDHIADLIIDSISLDDIENCIKAFIKNGGDF